MLKKLGGDTSPVSPQAYQTKYKEYGSSPNQQLPFGGIALALAALPGYTIYVCLLNYSLSADAFMANKALREMAI